MVVIAHSEDEARHVHPDGGFYTPERYNMRYILIATQVYTGTPNILGLFVLGREGWLPWPAVEGQTNCTDPDLCLILSFPTWSHAQDEFQKIGIGTIVAVDVDHPVKEGLYEVGPQAETDEFNESD